MPFGMKNYDKVDRLGRFLQGLAAGSQQVQLAQAQQEKHAREVQAAQQAVAPLYKALQGEDVTTPIDVQGPTAEGPALPQQTVTQKVYPSKEKLKKLEMSTFLDLLSQGTKTASDAAETYTKFKQFTDQKPSSELLRSETVTGDNGFKKRLDTYGYRDDTGEHVTDVKDISLTPPKEAGSVDLFGEKENIKNLEAYRKAYNNASGTIKATENEFGGKTKVQDKIKELSQQHNSIGDYLTTQDDANAESKLSLLLMGGMDPSTKDTMIKMRNYLKAQGSIEGARLNLQGLGKDVDETGKLIDYKESSGYYKGGKSGYFGN